MKYIQILILGLVGGVLFAGQLIAQDFSRTVRYIETMQSSRGIPGLSYAITRGTEIVRSGGLGVRSVDTGQPVTDQTLFHIGSTHKSITALLIARLVEAGALRWNSTVGDLSPGQEFSDSVVPRLTLHQLMTMTSGILDYSEDEFYDEYGDFATPENVISFMQNYRIPELPNKEFSYSNLAVSYAGYLVANAFSGGTEPLNQRYAALLQQWVLDPIGMDSSTLFFSEARASDNFSVSHTKSGGTAVVAETEDRDDDMFAPAGSLKSNAIDMGRYLIAVVSKGTNYRGEQIINQKRTVKKLWKPTPVSKVSKDYYGRGWERKKYSGVKIIMHEGAFDNFTSVIAIAPRQRTGLVILVNTEYTSKLLSKAPQIFAAESKKVN